MFEIFLKPIDNLLNLITMYKLIMYFLMALILLAIILGFTGVIPYRGLDIIYEVLILLFGCYFFNLLLGKIFRVPTNGESSVITSLILTLIITPGLSIIFLILAIVFSQISKYIFAFRGRHIFNPSAIAVVATIMVIGQGASWWVGNQYLLPLVVVGGLLIARKLQHFDLVISFLIVNLVFLGFRSSDPVVAIKSVLINSSLLYFAFVMLTEPLTTPPTRMLRIAYGCIVAVISSLTFSIGPIYSSPELALVLGNIFSFIVSDKARYFLTLKSKTEVAKEIYDFAFTTNHKLKHKPGQYLEWTLDTKKEGDSRGNRRYFTVASSPTENEVHLGSKFYENSSAFKKSLLGLNVGDKAFAGQLAGEFTMPKDVNKKLVFIAGGIGITPFRSMLKYLVDTNEKRDIVVFYSVKTEEEIAYKDIFDQASDKLGVKIVYVVTDKVGYLDAEKIKKEVNVDERVFYISGPRGMVVAFEKLLKDLGVSRNKIKIDFFPGYV